MKRSPLIIAVRIRYLIAFLLAVVVAAHQSGRIVKDPAC
jgi:hypothetical protein